MQPESGRVIRADVSMDERSFIRFLTFDAFRHRKSWQSPVIFAGMMLAFAAVCFFMRERQGAVLLGVVLAAVGLGLPIVWFCFFPGQAKKAAERMKLVSPRHVYTLTFSEDGIGILLFGRSETDTRMWQSLYRVYRVPGAMYLYADKGTAYLVPDASLDAPADELWDMMLRHMPKGACRVTKAL